MSVVAGLAVLVSFGAFAALVRNDVKYPLVRAHNVRTGYRAFLIFGVAAFFCAFLCRLAEQPLLTRLYWLLAGLYLGYWAGSQRRKWQRKAARAWGRVTERGRRLVVVPA